MTDPARKAPDPRNERSAPSDGRGVPRERPPVDPTALRKPVAREADQSVSAASLEGFGTRIESIHGSSSWVAFKTANEISKALAPRQWGLFLRLGEDPVFRYASGGGFQLPARGDAAIPRDLIDAWPIAHRVAGPTLDALKMNLTLAGATGFKSLDALRFGDRCLFLSDRPIEPRPSGTLEAAFAALGSRLDPTMARVVGKHQPIPCAATELGKDLARTMRMMGATHMVLASFEVSGIRDAMAREYGAEPGFFMSLVARVASSLLAETGRACVLPDSGLTVYVLTRSPPDPELLAAQFASSLSRAVGGFEKTELPILGFHSVHSDKQQGLDASIAAFLGSLKSRR